MLIRSDDNKQTNLLREVENINLSATGGRDNRVGRSGLGESKRSRADSWGRADTEDLEANLLSVTACEIGSQERVQQDWTLRVNQSRALLKWFSMDRGPFELKTSTDTNLKLHSIAVE